MTAHSTAASTKKATKMSSIARRECRKWRKSMASRPEAAAAPTVEPISRRPSR